jgi:hypothetical protein
MVDKDNHTGVKVVLLTHESDHTIGSLGPLWNLETQKLATSPVLRAKVYTLAPQDSVIFNKGFFGSINSGDFEILSDKTTKTRYILTLHKPLEYPTLKGIYLLTSSGYSHSFQPLVVDIVRRHELVHKGEWFSVHQTNDEASVTATNAYVFIDIDGTKEDEVKRMITGLLTRAKKTGRPSLLYLTLLTQTPSDKRPRGYKKDIIELVQPYTKDPEEEVEVNKPFQLNPSLVQDAPPHGAPSAPAASETLFVLMPDYLQDRERALKKDATLTAEFEHLEFGHLQDGTIDYKLRILADRAASVILLAFPSDANIGTKEKLYKFLSESIHVTRILVHKADLRHIIGAIPLTHFYMPGPEENIADEHTKKIGDAGYYTLKKRTEETDMHRIYIVGGSSLKAYSAVTNRIMSVVDAKLQDRRRHQVHIQEARLLASNAWEGALQYHLETANSEYKPSTLLALDIANEDTYGIVHTVIKILAEVQSKGLRAPHIVLFNSNDLDADKDKGIKLYTLYTLDELKRDLESAGAVGAVGPVGAGGAKAEAARVVVDAAKEVLATIPSSDINELNNLVNSLIPDQVRARRIKGALKSYAHLVTKDALTVLCRYIVDHDATIKEIENFQSTNSSVDIDRLLDRINALTANIRDESEIAAWLFTEAYWGEILEVKAEAYTAKQVRTSVMQMQDQAEKEKEEKERLESAAVAEAASEALFDMVTGSTKKPNTGAVVLHREPSTKVKLAAATLLRESQKGTWLSPRLRDVLSLGAITGIFPVGSLPFNIAAIESFYLPAASSLGTNSLVRGSRGTTLRDLVTIARSFIMDYSTNLSISSNTPSVGFCGNVTEKDEILSALRIRKEKADIRTIEISHARDAQKGKELGGAQYDYVVIGGTCSTAITDLAAVYLIVLCKLARVSVSVIAPVHLYENIQKQVCEALSLQEKCGILEWVKISAEQIMITMALKRARKILGAPMAQSATQPSIIGLDAGSMVAAPLAALPEIGIAPVRGPETGPPKQFVIILCPNRTDDPYINSALKRHGLEGGMYTHYRVESDSAIPVITRGDATLLVTTNDNGLQNRTKSLFFTRVVFDVQNQPKTVGAAAAGALKSVISKRKNQEKPKLFYSELHERMVQNGMYKLTAEKDSNRYYDRQKVSVCKVNPAGCTVPSKPDITHIINQIPGITQPVDPVIQEAKIASATPASCHFTIVRCSNINSIVGAIQTFSPLEMTYKPERIIAWSETADLIDDNIGNYTKVLSIELPSDKNGQRCWMFSLDKSSTTKFGAFV